MEETNYTVHGAISALTLIYGKLFLEVCRSDRFMHSRVSDAVFQREKSEVPSGACFVIILEFDYSKHHLKVRG